MLLFRCLIVSLTIDLHLDMLHLLVVPSQAKHLQYLCPEARRIIDESSLICVDNGTIPDKIHLRRLDQFRPLDKLPPEEEKRRG